MATSFSARTVWLSSWSITLTRITHVQKQTLLEGNLATPVATSGKFTSGALINIAYTASTTGGGFIDDKAHDCRPR